MPDPDATAPLAEAAERPATTVGTLIGRYVVLAPLGAGGGGEVVAAFDPQLDRKVAVKRLRSGRDTDLLLREARMLAKLKHPNVVTIHDVGVENGEAYLTMELVEGRDLGAWLRAHPGASASERLELLRSAAAGLHAAHQAGVVHGDVKPANVLVGDDGHVQVGDFGVARLVSADDASGAVVGTPRYMAPEQHEGRPADVRSDVYAFALTAWETLCGDLPFRTSAATVETARSGTSVEPSVADDTRTLELSRAKHEGPPPLPSTLPSVPGARGLFETLRAALQPDAQARPADLAPVLSALRPPTRSRWWIPTMLTIGVGSLTAIALRGDEPDERCAGSEDRIAEVWSPARADALEQHWTALGAPWSGAATPLRGELDDYAARWVTAHHANCEATSILAEQSAEDGALRNRCLLDARASLDASTALLETASPAIARRADALVASLPDLQRCGDVRRVEASTPVPDDTDLRDAVEAVRDALPATRAELAAGRYAQARTALEPLVERATTLGYAPLSVELSVLWAQALDRTGDAAYPTWEACVRDGLRYGLHRHAFKCAGRMAERLAERDARYDAAETWMTVAEGLAARPDADTNAPNVLLRIQSTIAFEQSDYARARELDQMLVDRLSEAPDRDGRSVGRALISLGNTEYRSGDLKTAEATLRKALEMLEAEAGPEHPETAAGVMNLATVLEARGANEDSLALLERSRQAFTTALGPEHDELALVHTNIAINLTALGRFDDALAEYDRALSIVRVANGPDHVEAGRVLMNIGVVHLRRQDFDAAEQTLTSALKILTATLPEHHDHRVSSTMNLALAFASKGELAKARPLIEQVLVSREATLPANHPSLANTRGNLGHILLDLGDPAAAQAQFEAALAIRAANPSRPKDRAFETLGLGRSKHAQGQKKEGVALAREAIELWREAGPGYDSYREEAEAWLKQVGG